MGCIYMNLFFNVLQGKNAMDLKLFQLQDQKSQAALR